ncbi:MAG: dihydrolipoyl dehydrogenase [Candidatus Marinimicrobia bacterium]|nr:dihydrolipoyl dehydrogenase [Candidatus Neomarinimicrobiota bacterium]MBT7377817.1 dihydrolipoyl dehydrogenase [Candidatus Neomarinimicrobiota bacterium]
MANTHFELIIIGAGPGGYAAAFRAADLGKQVLLIDKFDDLGGVCLNRGCIPSKALLHLAKVINDAKSVESLGVTFETPTLEIDKIRTWKESVISQLNKGIAQMAKARGVSRATGTAKFLSNNLITVEGTVGNSTYTFDDCIIATGSKPAKIPTFPEDPRIISSTGALALEDIPKNLLVVGGGYIGLEMGSVYHAFGSKVTVVEFMSSLLPGADADLVKPLQKKLTADFNKIYLSTKVIEIKPETDGLSVHFETTNGEKFTESFDKVLVSVGRKPNTENLGLEKAGITPTVRGFIPVNDKRQTSVNKIYAIGDITGDPMLAHKATHEGKIAAEVISGDESSSFDPKAIPAVIFTDPEIAWAGPTEAELKRDGIPFVKGEFPWQASGRAIALDRTEGKTKILADPETNIIIGIGIVGINAGDLIGEGMLAIEMGADAEDIGLTIHPHPSLSETVANAAEIIEGTITDLYIPKSK